MRIGILGSGLVGQTLGGKLVERGHDVALGTRSPEKLEEDRGMGMALSAWLDAVGGKARLAHVADAAAHGEIVVNATSGSASLAALRPVGKHLDNKILIDVANPLDFSHGMPPTLTICNTDSLGEQIQREFPRAKVVKTLNTVNVEVMIDPGQIANGDHHIFVSGNDAAAKADVTRFVGEWFGWKEECVIDLGDISTARGTEMMLALWIRLYAKLGTGRFNFRIVREAPAQTG